MANNQHQNLVITIALDHEDIVHTKTILTGKNITTTAASDAIKKYLAETNFKDLWFYDFEPEYNEDSITEWLKECENIHHSLSVKAPDHDTPLQLGVFKSDRKYSQYGILELNYQRRYLENE